MARALIRTGFRGISGEVYLHRSAVALDLADLSADADRGQLERRQDFMIVDTAAGIAANTLDFCNASHEVLVVVCDDPASITDAYATIKVLNGAAAGREVALTKVVTTVGKPGVQVASITRRPGGYAFAHVEGATRPSVNGVPLTSDSIPLRNGDVIELAGTQMQFIHP